MRFWRSRPSQKNSIVFFFNLHQKYYNFFLNGGPDPLQLDLLNILLWYTHDHARLSREKMEPRVIRYFKKFLKTNVIFWFLLLTVKITLLSWRRDVTLVGRYVTIAWRDVILAWCDVTPPWAWQFCRDTTMTVPWNHRYRDRDTYRYRDTTFNGNRS